jgi:ketosteroid isomerase-like protein
MVRRFMLAGVVLALVVAAGVAAASQAAGGESQADRLRAIETDRLAAVVAGDTAAAGRVMAPDFQLINPAGATASRDEFLGLLDAGVIDFAVSEPSGPIEVRMSGDSATLRYPHSFDLMAGGTHLVHEGWTTALYERRDGRWRIVWEQSTAIPNQPDLLIQALEPLA